MNLYEVLNVSEKASEEQIKQAYRGLAKKYHPDLNPGNTEAEKYFKDIVDAYEVLGNQEKRKEYDESSKYGTRNVKGQKATGYQPMWRDSPEQMMGNFSKDMEAFFGFPFTKDKKTDANENKNAAKANPIDVTKMFEAFMKIK